ncbi:flagellar motor protein MotB [Nocardioides sp.]|uniref:flagellar motor protein MotB n=1 Tax=Nocardioides sp. TaxID=35761 RepID=UPI002B278E0C|nr:flagellar motor protein MotB [Nocardioides sp.]
MATRRAKKEEPEEHENHERWLVTYADMVTLLMVLFIVMFAISQVDERKFNELAEGMAAGFGSQDSILDGASSLHTEPGYSPVRPVAPQLADATLSDEQRLEVEQAVARNEELARDRTRSEAQLEVDRLAAIRRALLEALREEGLERDVTTSFDGRGLVLSLVSRHVVFQADRSELSARGREVVDALAQVLRTLDDPLQIDGHTNQVPVKPAFFATDWDLSAARAVTVLRRLEEVAGLATDRLSMAAFGATRPLLDPTDPRSQAINKRVDIVVLSTADPEAAALIPALAGADRTGRTGRTDRTGRTGRTRAAADDPAPAAIPNDIGEAAAPPDPPGERP